MSASATFAGVGVSGLGGGAGETGAQLLSEGRITDWGDVGIEAVAELMFGTIEVGAMYAGMAKDKLRARHEQDLGAMDAQAQAVQQSKLRERAPEVFHEHMREVVEQSDSPHVYLDGNALHQSGLMQAFLDAAPEYAPAVQEALATGGSVQVRTEDFAVHVMADAGLYASLRPHARLDADGLSLAEIENHAEAELQADLTRRTREMAKMEAEELAANDVFNHIHGQIAATGRFEEKAARTQAMLATAFFETMAGRMGEKINPLFERMGLRIVAGQHGRQGEGLNQSVLLDFGDRSTEELEAEYAALTDEAGNNRTDGGHLIDVDLIRELSAEYRADRSLSPQIHRAASALSKELYARALARPAREDKIPKVRFMAGGGGSGKSSAAARFLTDQEADITFDGTLSNLNKAKENIEAALASGRDAEIVYVYRSPEKSADGAIQRAIQTGRPVPIDALAEAHAQSGKVVKALAEAYNNDERVSIRAIWNDGDSLDSTRLIPIEEIPDVSQDQAESAFRSALERARVQGNVHPRTYAAFAQSTRGYERTADDRGAAQPPAQESSADTLNQDPAASGVFSSQEAGQGSLTPEQAEFAQTAKAYGGEAAYEAAREAGQTELTYRQWVQVRTPAFKAWFGDWENDPDNASKVVNEKTGEPLVVYHGTDAEFSEFDVSRQNPGWMGKAFYFSIDPAEAADYGSRVVAAFLNVRQPFVVQMDTVNQDGSVNFAPDLAEQMQNKPAEADGVFYGSYFAAQHPNQIKSATDNSGAFSPDNDSILYQGDQSLEAGGIAGDTNTSLTEMATPVREAKSFDEARAAVEDLLNKPIINHATGMTATVSKRSLHKMLSGKASRKSSTLRDHLAARQTF